MAMAGGVTLGPDLAAEKFRKPSCRPGRGIRREPRRLDTGRMHVAPGFRFAKFELAPQGGRSRRVGKANGSREARSMACHHARTFGHWWATTAQARLCPPYFFLPIISYPSPPSIAPAISTAATAISRLALHASHDQNAV